MIILPIHIVSGLQLPVRKKAIVMFIFALRLMYSPTFQSPSHLLRCQKVANPSQLNNPLSTPPYLPPPTPPLVGPLVRQCPLLHPDPSPRHLLRNHRLQSRPQTFHGQRTHRYAQHQSSQALPKHLLRPRIVQHASIQ